MGDPVLQGHGIASHLLSILHAAGFNGKKVRIVELGSGQGRLHPYIEDRLKFLGYEPKIVGIEFNPFVVEEGKRKGRSIVPGNILDERSWEAVKRELKEDPHLAFLVYTSLQTPDKSKHPSQLLEKLLELVSKHTTVGSLLEIPVLRGGLEKLVGKKTVHHIDHGDHLEEATVWVEDAGNGWYWLVTHQELKRKDDGSTVATSFFYIPVAENEEVIEEMLKKKGLYLVGKVERDTFRSGNHYATWFLVTKEEPRFRYGGTTGISLRERK